MRGKGKARHNRGTDFGITPAYAGKSTGDYTKEQYEAGSPPPMRGKAQNRINRIINCGITPAYAGKSFSAPEI